MIQAPARRSDHNLRNRVDYVLARKHKMTTSDLAELLLLMGLRPGRVMEIVG